MQGNTYDPKLAQLRFFASLSVALYHLWTLQVVPIVLFRPGWLGVPLFFSLSVFLLLNRLDVNNSLKRYFKRRIQRIYPLYYASATVVFVVQLCYFHSHVTLLELLYHYLFVSYVLAPFSFNYVFWSLQLEEWMYFVIPLIHRLSDEKKLVVAKAFIFTTLVYTFFVTLLPYNEFHTLYFMPPTWLGAYGWGIYAYVMKKRGVRPKGSSLLYILMLYIMYIVTAGIGLSEVMYEFFVRFILYNAFLAILPALLIDPPKVLSKVTVFLGEVSYGVYVWHLLFEELYGLVGVVIGVLVAIMTEFPLRAREITKRLEYGKTEKKVEREGEKEWVFYFFPSMARSSLGASFSLTAPLPVLPLSS